MNPLELLIALIIYSDKRDSMLKIVEKTIGIDTKNLVITRLICEKIGLMDGERFSSTLAKFADEYYEELKDLDTDELIEYRSKWLDELRMDLSKEKYKGGLK